MSGHIPTGVGAHFPTFDELQTLEGDSMAHYGFMPRPDWPVPEEWMRSSTARSAAERSVGEVAVTAPIVETPKQ
jgi:hypothetical protein